MKWNHARDEFRVLSKTYVKGVELLNSIQGCLKKIPENFNITLEEIDKKFGELSLWFAGIKLYVKLQMVNWERGYFIKLVWGRYKREKDQLIQDKPLITDVFDGELIWYKENKEHFNPQGCEPDDYIFDHICGAIRDLFPETDEKPPKRPGGIDKQIR